MLRYLPLSLKLKIYGIAGLLIFLLMIVMIAIDGGGSSHQNNVNKRKQSEFDSGVWQLQAVSEDVLKHRDLVIKYCEIEGILEHVNVILAIIMVESGGRLPDVMQSSESAGLPPNTFTNPEESIRQGVKYYASLVARAAEQESDINAVIQSYNYGQGFLGYVARQGNTYSFELAEAFAKEYSGGVKISYSNPIAVSMNGGWRWRYGNMFYVPLVKKYVVFGFDGDSSESFKVIMDELIKYQGWKYKFGGSNPSTSFDCSGLMQWGFKTVGVNLPRTAAEQYRFVQKIKTEDAVPGDLVFFSNTYKPGISHVGIYVGDGKMYHAGDPIGFAPIHSGYWQNYFTGYGRVSLPE